MDEQKSGIVYVLTNPAMPGLIKVGITQRTSVHDRLSELSRHAGVPLPFQCEFACTVEDCKLVERKIHNAFDNSRENPKKEFFSLEPEHVISILELVSTGDATPQVETELTESVPKEEIDAAKRFRLKRPPLNFFDMGIPEGSVLEFTEFEAQVIVAEPKKVKYNGEIKSLTFVTRELLKLDYNRHPTPLWTHNGRPLKDIYKECYGTPQLS